MLKSMCLQFVCVSVLALLLRHKCVFFFTVICSFYSPVAGDMV